MKVLLVILFVSGGLVFARATRAQASIDDASKGVLIMSADTDALPRAFAAEKSCGGLHQVQWGGHTKDRFGWSLSLVNDGRGAYQVTLMTVASTSGQPDHYVYLGTNTKKAVKKACSIINGREKPVWMVAP